MLSHEFYVSAPNDCKRSAASTKACMRNELVAGYWLLPSDNKFVSIRLIFCMFLASKLKHIEFWIESHIDGKKK